MFNFFKKSSKKNTKEVTKTVETKTNENEKNYKMLRSQVTSAVSSVNNGAEKAYINDFTGFFIRKESGRYVIYQEGIYQSTRSDKEAIIRFVVNRYPNRYAI